MLIRLGCWDVAVCKCECLRWIRTMTIFIQQANMVEQWIVQIKIQIQIKSKQKQLQSGQKTLEAQFKFGHNNCGRIATALLTDRQLIGYTWQQKSHLGLLGVNPSLWALNYGCCCCCCSCCVNWCYAVQVCVLMLYDGVCMFSETNLKVRQALTETSLMGDDIQQLSSFNGLTKSSLLFHYFG